jgi:hypothetical protein
MADDPTFEDEPVPEEEPETWRPPVPCPQCGQTQTRFVTYHYEVAVYECDLCRAQFEAETE